MATADPAPPPHRPPPPRLTRRLATDGISRSATEETATEYASRASSSLTSAASTSASRRGSEASTSSSLPGRGGTTTDLDGPLVVAADEPDLEREFERGKCLEQLVGVGHRPATDVDDQVAGLDPGSRGWTAVLDATDQDAVTLGEADRPAHAARDVGWGDRHSE